MVISESARELGRKGGLARTKKLTKEQLSEIGRKGYQKVLEKFGVPLEELARKKRIG